MNRYNKLLVAAGAAALSAGLYTSVASAASVTDALASARVITPMTIIKGAELNFGDVGVGPLGGDVILATDGGRSLGAGDAELITGGTVTAASFTIGGQPGKAYTLTFPGTVDISGNVGTMDVTSFTDTSLGTVPIGGSEIVNVGATLSIGGAQPANAYSAPYTVTVDYQ